MHVAGLKMPEAYDGKCNNRNKKPLTLSIVPLIYMGIPIRSVATFANEITEPIGDVKRFRKRISAGKDDGDESSSDKNRF